MQPHEPVEGSPRYWLRRAQSVLEIARTVHPPARVLPADLCFNAQQAAEKAIKGVLVHDGCELPEIHHIGKLLDTVALRRAVPPAIRVAAELTAYAVQERYGGRLSRTSFDDLAIAVEQAQTVCASAEQIIA